MNVYEIITERMLEALKAGTVPWQKPWKGGKAGFPVNHVSGKAYRGVNPILLGMGRFACNRFLTYKQAEGIGAQVRKGEKGLPVIFYKTFPGEKKDDGKKERGGFMLRYSTVFNVAQCDGIELPEAPETILPDVPPIEAAEAIIANRENGAPILHGYSMAAYSPSNDQIMLPDRNLFNGPGEYYSTVFHEITHSTGHVSRLNRLEPGRFGSHAYSKEELVAEMGAAFLCATSGIETTFDNSAAYIASWSTKLAQDPKLIIQAAAQAQKATDYVLNVKATVPDEAPALEMSAA